MSNYIIFSKIKGKTIKIRMKSLFNLTINGRLADEVKLVSIAKDLPVDKKKELIKDKFKEYSGLTVEVDDKLTSTFVYEDYNIYVSIKKSTLDFSAKKIYNE